ncbi:MAG: methyltransferase domain-containing protein [Actinomycetota bacterium]
MSNPLEHDRYRRSNRYDPAWVIENQMGPNALWLTESLTEVLPLEEGMKVLDLGCGRAMSSIFLAREFGATVTAADLWIEASDNQARIEEAGVADLVQAVNAEAHTLPFARGSFDAIVSLDAYQYFGTADLYLGQLVEFLKPGGRLGIVVPSLTSELGEAVPETLAPYWEWDFCCFHTPAWWRHHWTKTGKVEVEHVDVVDNGWQDWLRFNDATAPHVRGWMVEACRNTHDMLEADRGANLCFTRMVARRP